MLSPHPSLALLKSSLFKRSIKEDFLDVPSRIELSYGRAKAIGLLYSLSITDIKELSSKFWELNSDPILTFDCGAVTLLTIQYNLVLGTLVKFLPEREDLKTIADDLLNYRTIGQFCLTELKGGLDVLHMGTTATLLENGDFELHTPTPSDAKFMPPTIPVLGIPCVAVVFSRLIVRGEYRGIRPFLVTLNDGYTMSRGITATLLPPRGGSTPVNHSITSFNHVILPPTALLGSVDMPKSIHSDFLSHISRLSVGALVLATGTAQGIALCADIAGLYNIRRLTTGADGVTRVPIITFSTQQRPILTAVALSYVIRALVKKSVSLLSSSSNPGIQRGVAVCTKAAVILRSRASMLELTERCGAQGLYGYNQISRMFSDIHGTSIAEGDIIGLSIRVVIDILMGKFVMPPPNDSSSLLATYEEALIQDCRESMFSQPPSKDMKEAFNKNVLPSCQKIVEAIGHRMAYDAAVEALVPQYLVDLFVASTIPRDSSWFIENMKLSRKNISNMEQTAVDEAMPHLQELLDGLGVREYITAPIITDESWDEFRRGLPHYSSSLQSESVIRALL